MRLGFLYAGQGSQHPGMGQDLYDAYPAFRAVLDRAETDFDLKKLCFEGPAAFAAGLTAVLREMGIAPDLAAGLSLGEYSALAAAGVFGDQEAISLTAFRGRVMEEAAAGRDSAMIAVLGLDREALQEACREAEPLGTVVIANYNCPGQLRTWPRPKEPAVVFPCGYPARSTRL